MSPPAKLCDDRSSYAVSLDLVPVTAGRPCTATARIRLAPGTGPGPTVRIGIDWRDRDGGLVTDTANVTDALTQTFSEYLRSGVAPPNAAFAAVFVGANGNLGDCVLVDDVAIECF